MTLEYKAEMAAIRMSEFYEVCELEAFINFLTENDFPRYEGMLFLDGQTRMNYLIDEREPCICNYMELTYRYFNEENQ